MSDTAISKIKEAEEKARLFVNEANEKRKSIIESATSEALEKYSSIISEANSKRDEKLESSKQKAIEDSKELEKKASIYNDSIKNIDKDTVDGLVNKIVERIVS
ncbi:hypothetical protein [uncultured Finegoldia sp.]|uniref:hypothetical protein n=1 Tax=uncultured Finegoldia sp. TaxID=328009 RepID=UPI00260B021E|nr:hypothetical protein [uncultured Finegoldia sp.]